MEQRQTVIRYTGIVLIIGFFLPWIELGWLGSVSGWDIVNSSLVSNSTRLVVGLCPLFGLALSTMTSRSGSSVAAWFAVATGAVFFGYIGYLLVGMFMEVVGIGLLLVLLATTVAFVAGLMERGRLTTD